MKKFCNQEQFDEMKRMRAREIAQRLQQAGASITTGDTLTSTTGIATPGDVQTKPAIPG